MANVIEVFEKADFKVEYTSCLTTKGETMYGGLVYYKGKFIKLIPYTDRKELTKKYLKMLVDKHIINEVGIYIPCRDGYLEPYHYFNPNILYS